MTAVVRVMSIMSMHINNPLRHMEGNACKLSIYDCNSRKMSKKNEILDKDLVELQENYSKCLNRNHMGSIFREAFEQLPP